jgi:UDP-N-acetylglucosamine--N-acetylmuramyl-(pentapeptide) pyrophosphoryl-undecaprenol N-acetylglucosamine transferase
VRVLLAAGGTAGHVEPALNLADAIVRADPSAEITFIGGDRGLEGVLVPERGYELLTIPAVPLPRRPSVDLLALGPRLTRATRQAGRFIRRAHADVVVGFGGYAALPTYLAARRLGTTLVIHEANARAGVANKVGARLTRHVYGTFPGALPGAIHMGLPLRPAIAQLHRAELQGAGRRAFALPESGPVLLVFGGSQGATRLNAVVADALPALLESGISVLHAYGRGNPRPGEPAPRADAIYAPVPYIDRMDLAYAAADFAITRAGAMTCAELAAVGLPAAYVPLPIGNGEQRFNALPVVQAGGGLLLDNSDLTDEWVLSHIPPILHDRDRMESMGLAAATLGTRNADSEFAEVVLGIAERGIAPAGDCVEHDEGGATHDG